MASTRDTTWRYVLVIVAVALSLAAWFCTVLSLYFTVNVTFESYLTASVWVLLFVASVLLYTSQHGLVPNCILFYPVFGASFNLLLGSLTVRSQLPFVLRLHRHRHCGNHRRPSAWNGYWPDHDCPGRSVLCL